MMNGAQASRGIRLQDDEELRREGLLSWLRLHFPRKYRFKEKEFPHELDEKRYVIDANMEKRQFSKLERAELGLKIEAERAKKRLSEAGPLGIQDRVHRKEISFTKARELTRLIRKPLSTMVDRVKFVERGAKGKIVRGGETAERTDEHVSFSRARLTRKPSRTTVVDGRSPDGRLNGASPQPAERTEEPFNVIRVITEDASRGGSIRSVDTVARAVDSYTAVRELTRLTWRKPEGPAGPSGKIVKRGEGGRIMSGSRPLDERTEGLEEDNRELSILSVQLLFLEDD